MDSDLDIFHYNIDTTTTTTLAPNLVNTRPLSDNIIAPFVPCHPSIALEALKILNLKLGDTVMDLGSGDGRILQLLHTNFPQVNGIGVEFDELLVKYCHLNYKHLNVIKGDMFTCDLSGVGYFVLYLLPLGLKRIKHRFKDVVVATIQYSIPDVDYIVKKDIMVQDSQMGGSKSDYQSIYLYQF
jgi:hypothetical protein